METVAEIFLSPNVFTVQEVGIFPCSDPEPLERVPSNAIQQTPSRVGLASWALNPLYVSAKQRLVNDRTDFLAATAMLIASPDFLTAWNVRKLAFTPRNVKKELHFTALVLTRNPKSAEAWTHRNWVIRTIGLGRISVDTELRLTWMAATRAPCNYYATVHRLRLLPSLTTAKLSRELEQSRTWLRTHVSDSSGWAYHRMLIQVLLKQNQLQGMEENAWFQNMAENYASAYQNIAVHNRWLQVVLSAPSISEQV